MDIPESKIKQQNTYNENDDQDSIDLIYKEESEDKSQDNKTNDEHKSESNQAEKQISQNKIKRFLNKEVDLNTFLDKYIAPAFAFILPVLGLVFYFWYRKKEVQLAKSFLNGFILSVSTLFMILLSKFLFTIYKLTFL